MQNFCLKLSALALVGIWCLPSVSEAYQTTNQWVYQVSDNTYLFAVSYYLGSEKYEFRTPILADRVNSQSQAATVVEYDFVSPQGTSYQIGKSAAIVLADLEVENTKYILPRGESAEFTLLTIFRVSDGVLPVDGVALQVSALPFDLVADDGVYENGLNQSELKKFVTPLISIRR